MPANYGRISKKTCETCGKPFPAQRPWARFCSAACNRKAQRERKRQEIERMTQEIAKLKSRIAMETE